MKKLFGVKLLSVAMLFIAAALVLTSCKISVILPGDTPVGGSVADGDGTKVPDIKDTSKQPDNEENSDSKNGGDQAAPTVGEKDMYKFDGKYYIAVGDTSDIGYINKVEFTSDGNVVLDIKNYGLLFTFNENGYPEKVTEIVDGVVDESEAIPLVWKFNESSLPEKLIATGSDVNINFKYDENGSISEILRTRDESHNNNIKIEIKYSDNGKRTAYLNGEENASVNILLDILYFADYSDKNVVKGDDGVYHFTLSEKFNNMAFKLVELTPEQALKIHRIALIMVVEA